MTGRRKKDVKKGPIRTVEIRMSPDLIEAADTVAGWDHKTRSQYFRDLVLRDARLRGLLKPGEGMT